MLTDQDIRAITYLVLACRPVGAPRWDEPGVLANLGKLRDRDLASVSIAAIRAAGDRKAVSPGVIPKNGPHWRTPEAPSLAEVYPFDRQRTCNICSLTETACRERWSRHPEDPHQFVSVAAAARAKAEVNEEVAAALRAQLASATVCAHGTLREHCTEHREKPKHAAQAVDA